jgi:hypothetical protein
MATSAQRAFDEIKAYIDKLGWPYSAWYAGIASNVETRLFTDHNISRSDDKWVYDGCPNNQGARSVESELLKLGCDGGSGGGDQSSTYAYAYLKSHGTNP